MSGDTWRTLGGHGDTWRTIASLLDLTQIESTRLRKKNRFLLSLMRLKENDWTKMLLNDLSRVLLSHFFLSEFLVSYVWLVFFCPELLLWILFDVRLRDFLLRRFKIMRIRILVSLKILNFHQPIKFHLKVTVIWELEKYTGTCTRHTNWVRMG